MSANLVVRHRVNDYAAWRAVFEELEPLRAKYGCTGAQVLHLPDDANDLMVTHEFESAEQATAFAQSDELRAGMGRGGVDGAPSVEIFTSA